MSLAAHEFLTSFDLHLLGQGNHFRSYQKLGAHPAVVDGVSGVAFAVWAPNAEAVSVIGDFNYWSPGADPLSVHHGAGVWEGFIPGLAQGALYK